MPEITDVVVNIHVGSSNPILPIIKAETAIRNGAGTYTETILGGQVSIHVVLNSGEVVKKLKTGEFAYVTGKMGGSPFVINSALTVDSAHEPWKFSRVSGSTG